jgi:hypothetical protein
MRAVVVAESLFSSFEVYPRQPHHFSIADYPLAIGRIAPQLAVQAIMTRTDVHQFWHKAWSLRNPSPPGGWRNG